MTDTTNTDVVVDTTVKPAPVDITPEVKTQVLPTEIEAAKVVTPETPALDYQTYADPSATLVVDLLKDAGITATQAQDIFKDAVASLDINKVDWKSLQDKHGNAKTAALKLAVETYYVKAQARVQANVNEVHATVGGKDNWAVVSAWAVNAAKTDAAFKTKLEDYNKLFDMSPMAAKFAATELVTAFNADKRNTTLNTTTLVAGTTGVVNTTSVPTHRADYIKALTAAHKAGDTTEVARLRAGRAAYLAS